MKALRVGRCIALPHLRPWHLDRGGWSAPRPGRFIPGKTRYPLYRRLGGPQGRSGWVRKNSPPTGIRSLDRPARSESLYRLSYPGPFRTTVWLKNTDADRGYMRGIPRRAIIVCFQRWSKILTAINLKTTAMLKHLWHDGWRHNTRTDIYRGKKLVSRHDKCLCCSRYCVESSGPAAPLH